MKLRKLKREDLAIRVEWMNDPRVYETMHFALPITLEGTEKWFNNIKNNSSRMDFVLEDNGVICVMNGLTGKEAPINKVESYTMVNPNYKSKGFGTKALFLKSVMAFEVMKVNKIWCFIDSDNVPSLKMCEKIGYKIEGIMREEVSRNGKLVDRCYLGCLSSDLKMDLFDYMIDGDEIILNQ